MQKVLKFMRSSLAKIAVMVAHQFYLARQTPYSHAQIPSQLIQFPPEMDENWLRNGLVN